MKLNMDFFRIHTDIKIWRGLMVLLFGNTALLLVGVIMGHVVEASTILVTLVTLICGTYLGIILFQFKNKPEVPPKPVNREYWLFTKDPTRRGVYGPYTKSEAIMYSTDFNDSYPLNAPAIYVKAKNREDAQLAAKDLRK